ncbi:HlyD family efflux transporter periplasmic adaptor subunit [Bacillaceae bacterium W0354]
MKKILGILLLSTVLILSACNEEKKETTNKETEIPVQMSDVRVDDFTTERTYIARSMPSDYMPVLLQSPGEVDKLFVEKGETVEEGDKIAEIITPQNIRLEVEAPMDGMIQELNLVEGRFASNEQPAAVVVDVESLILSYNVPANEVEKFSVSDEVNFHASQLDESGKATITYVAKTAGDTGMYAVEAEVEKSGAFLAGMTVQIVVEEVLAEDVLILPTAAVVERSGESFVYIVENGKAIEVAVEVIVMQTEETAVNVAGDVSLDEDSQVITRGQLTISDGQKVRIIEEGQ